MPKCQYCETPVNTGWTLCSICRTDYARQLHKLRGNLYLLQRMARREYKLGEPGNGGKPAYPPAPADLGLLDEIDKAESLLKDVWTTATGDWRVPSTWRRLVPRMQARMGDLARSPMAGRHMRDVIDLNLRLAPIVDRRPRTRRIVGHCPECGAEVTAAKGETFRPCECGAVVDVREVRETARTEVDRYHKTLTPAGCARWLKDEYGYQVSRKQVSNWLNRGKLPSSRPVADGYWEFSVREVLTLAMAAAG